MVPDIILEEEKDGFHQWADRYDQWDNISYTPVEKDDVGGSDTFDLNDHIFNIKKSNKMGHRRQEQSVNCLNQVTNQIFILTNVNHKHRLFETKY